MKRSFWYKFVTIDPNSEYSELNFFKAVLLALPLSLLFWLLLLVGLAYGQVSGHDFLALQSKSFNYSSFPKYIKKHSAIGFLDYTFGTEITPVRYMLDSGKFDYVRIHLINGSCIRFRNCGKYYPFGRYTRTTFNKAAYKLEKPIKAFLSDRTSLYCPLISSYPSTQFFFSPVLEHNLTTNAFKSTARLIRKVCPSAIVVNNPMGHLPIKPYLYEQHGQLSKYDNVTILSMDGFEKESLPKDYMHKAPIVFRWTRKYNCANDKFIDPRKRTSCPHINDVRSLEKFR